MITYFDCIIFCLHFTKYDGLTVGGSSKLTKLAIAFTENRYTFIYYLITVRFKIISNCIAANNILLLPSRKYFLWNSFNCTYNLLGAEQWLCSLVCTWSAQIYAVNQQGCNPQLTTTWFLHNMAYTLPINWHIRSQMSVLCSCLYVTSLKMLLYDNEIQFFSSNISECNWNLKLNKMNQPKT